MQSSKSDQELMILLSTDQDSDAWRELYLRHHTNLYRYLARTLDGNVELAEDVAEDVFLKVFEKAKQYNNSYAFSTWLYRMAINLMKNEWRKSSKSSGVDNLQIVTDETPEDILDLDLKKEKINQLLLQLSEAHKDTYVLRYQQCFSTKEVAEILRVSEGTVKSRLFKATQKISKYFNS
jgi:RNA polymerase sigma-70 factor (ECF subfamily)